MKKLILLSLALAWAAGVQAQQAPRRKAAPRPTEKPAKTQPAPRPEPAQQGNTPDRTLLRREREDRRDDSLRMKYDSVRNYPDTALRRQSARPAPGQRPSPPDPLGRGERDRMGLPPTPNYPRPDSLHRH